MKKIKEIELIAENEEDQLTAMGWVDLPAIEKNFIYFNDEKNNYVFAKVDDEKGIIVSPALIANKRIFRYNPFTNEEYYVYFKEDTIRKLSQDFLIKGNFKNNTEQHEDPVEGIHLIYSWIVENQQDQIITKYGFKNIPNGSWVVMYKIDNDDIKDKIKNGEINGISIEAYLTEKYDTMKSEVTDEIKIDMIRELLKNVKN